MEYDIGTELLIQSPGNIWMLAFVEEDDGDEIFIKYKDNGQNEWINKDSHRIKSKNEECVNKIVKTHNHTENVVPEVLPMIFNVQSTEKDPVKKSTANTRPSSVFKVKFKKDDFMTKKTLDSKLKEQKTVKDSKKTSDRESKQQLLLNNTPSSEKLIANSLKNTHVGNLEVESETNVESMDLLTNSNHLNETKLLRSENFEELLEDIEAEAEICSPTKSFSRSEVSKPKKKRRKFFFGQRRRPEKRKKILKSNDSKKKLVVKLNPPKLKRTDSTAIDKSNITDDAATPSKKLKPSPTSNLAVNPPSQPSTPTFHQIANNSLLQRIRMDASNEQGFRCPKQECRKLFRKENLLMMHIKHYHSEYTELLVSTPNVTDLATARIEGENVDELSPSYFLHRISQLEAKRSWGNTTSDLPSPNTSISTPIKLTEPEPEINISLETESFNTSFTASVEKPNSTTQVFDSKDSGFSGIIESVGLTIETPVKEPARVKEPIKKITLVDAFENETPAADSYGATRVATTGRHFKIKKNKSDVESLPKEEVINCSCALNQEDGLMIQCDVCLCWQHGYCNKIDSEDQVPDNYVCTSCLNPSKKRQSKQYDYLQDWIKEGKVASVLQHKDERRRKDENILKQSHQLVAEVVEHTNYLHSLLVKTAIYGQTPDHPKLYLWSEQGVKRNEEPLPDKLEELLSGPVPEKPINTAECRKNLLDEIEDGFNNLEARINLFEAKTNGLEDQVGGIVDDEILSNTVTLLLRDLNSIRHYMSVENQNKMSEEV